MSDLLFVYRKLRIIDIYSISLQLDEDIWCNGKNIIYFFDSS